MTDPHNDPQLALQRLRRKLTTLLDDYETEADLAITATTTYAWAKAADKLKALILEDERDFASRTSPRPINIVLNQDKP